MNRAAERPSVRDIDATEDVQMAVEPELMLTEQSALSAERELELARMANGIIDAVYANCEGNLGEVAVVLSSALASVLRSWPREAGCEMLVKAGRLLHRTLWATCSEGPGGGV
jgi:hypothetical protein